MAGGVFRGSDARVGFAELFYDLVFVFAITQVSHYLLYQYTPVGAVQTALMFLAIWWVWIYSTWVLNWLDPERTAVRGLLFALMAAGLFMSMAVPEAFASRGWIFALAYCGMQLGRTGFVLLVSQRGSQLHGTHVRIGIWFGVAAVFWMVGGFASPEARLWFWIVALGIEYLGPIAGYYVPGVGHDTAAKWSVHGGHMAERCGLFVIICLGETLLISGATFADKEWTGPGMLAFLSVVAGTVGMWWVYFHVGHKRGTHQIEHADDPGRLARLAFTYAHIPIVAGIVLVAVGAERAIADPGNPGVWSESASAIGGLALFLAGNGWFKRISGRRFPLSHLVGLGLCAGLVLVGPWLSLAMLTLLAALVLLQVALWEHLSLSPQKAAQTEQE